jgi:uncharacterized sulfatase
VHIRGEEKDGRDFGFEERGLRYYTYGKEDYVAEVGEEAVETYCPSKMGPSRLNPHNEPSELEESQMFDSLVVDRTMRFLEDHRDERFFAWVGLEKPHPTWHAPAEFHAMYDPREMAIPETFHDEPVDVPDIVAESNFRADDYPEEWVRNCIAAYLANVSYLDYSLGRLLEALERLGLSEDTLVIYTSDHGENLFEHALVQKHCFYEPSVAVPLICRGPKVVSPGRGCGRLVGLIDLFPTLADICGISKPSTLEGVSFADPLSGAPDGRGTDQFAEFYAKGKAERMIRTPGWKYVYTQGDLDQLYDVQADHRERRNLATEPEWQDTVEALRQRVWEDWEIEPDYDWGSY